MRWKWILGICICLIIALMATVYVLLRTYDYNNLKPRITRIVREATGRELSLGGEINLTIGFTPTLVATDITFGNAAWGSQPHMMQIDELRAHVRLLPLLVRNVAFRRFALKGVDVLLETNPDGQGNWEFSKGVASVRSAGVFSVTKIDADDIHFENLDLTFHNGKTGSATRFHLAALKMAKQGPDDGLAVDLSADYKEQRLTLSGKTGLVDELLGSKPFPLDLSGTFAHAAIKLQGAVDDVLKLEGIDLKIQTSGQDLAKFKIINHIQLPETDTFDLKGQLQGSKSALSLNDLSGHLSGSNIQLAFNGKVDDLSAVSGIDLQLKASGKNLAALGAIIKQKLPDTEEFNLQGRLTGTAKDLSLGEARGSAKRGSLKVALNGRIRDLIAFSGVDLSVSGSGKDLAAVGALINRKLPQTDKFALEGRLTGSAKILSLSEASGSASQGSLNLTVNGKIKDLYSFNGVDLDLKGGGINLAEIGKIIDQKLPVTDQFAVRARLTGSTQTLSLQEIRGSARRGSLNLTLSGGIEMLLALEGLHFRLKASGKEMAEIGPLIGTELPDLGPFDLSTTLSGSAKTILLSPFSLIVDQSDFNGLARVAFLKRPKITLRLESSVIDFTTLMNSLEKDSKKNSQKVVKKDSQKHRLFSDDPLPFDVLKKVDADIVLKAKNVHARDARLKFGFLTVMLENGDLSIDRLEAVYRQTKISGNLNINSGSPPQVATRFLVQDLDLGNLLKETGVNNQVRGHLDIAAHGKSSGYSVQDLMSELDGSIGAVMGKGYLTNYLNLLSLDLTHKVREIWGHIKEGDQIKCAVVQFDINKGMAASRAFVFDTQAGILKGKGEINLGTEKVNFLLVPKPSSPTLSLMTKLRVTGTIMNAKVRPDKLALLEKGATLLSTFVIGPLGLLAPFVRLGAHKKHPCQIKRLDELGLSVPVEK